ncbi:uncharacterized protein KY384_008252 [Bacidia gigantensis]|uniref:uncharacterized protein n=1 Tax=Bacidia gigantensis TaxID=2732470 RepID=UPI001D039224|nr:uncharacterized protein KY384_008252 [Bacidia gigantensis]KAG8526823.1 hypothetical protein KY384_008252 [Bacidia gigantensis]
MCLEPIKNDPRLLRQRFQAVLQLNGESELRSIPTYQYTQAGGEAQDKGAWACKATVESTKPTGDVIKGLKVVLKDNIALAGVPCTNGTKAIDWIPKVDATVVTRSLDAGGIVLGKAACENIAEVLRVEMADLLLEAIAGTDGIDDRQPYNHPAGTIKYADEVAKHMTIEDQPLRSIKIGVLEEGFQDPMTDPNVAKASHSAIESCKTLGAEVKSVHVPLHKDSGALWMIIFSMSGTQQGLLSAPTGRRQLLFPERPEQIGPQLSQQAFDALGPGGQNIYLRGLFLKDRYGARLHAHCTNLSRKLTDAYDAAFRDVDILVMPTVIFPPVKLRTPETPLTPLKMLSRTSGLTYNTATFNLTGHPALNLPVGFVPAQDDKLVKLPTGLQIVGRKFEDLLCLKVAASWEKANKWKEL